MSQRVERMIKDYPSMVMERDCLRHQLANFRGVTEEEVIDSMNFSSLSSPVIKCKKTPRKKCSFVAEVKGKR